MTVIVTPWLCLKMMKDLLWPTILGPKGSNRFRCTTCGDRFLAEYRLGCFGPVNIQVKRDRSMFSWSSAEPILCAHCGHDA